MRHLSIMPSGTIFTSVSTEPTIVVSLQAFTAACTGRTVEMAIHSFVRGRRTTGTPCVSDGRWLLLRLFVYQAMSFLADRPADPHLPDLTTDDGLHDFLLLRSLVILCPALDVDEYLNTTVACGHAEKSEDPNWDVSDTRPAITSHRFAEVTHAWEMVHQLDEHLDLTHRFTGKAGRSKAPKSFKQARMVSTSATPAARH